MKGLFFKECQSCVPTILQQCSFDFTPLDGVSISNRSSPHRLLPCRRSLDGATIKLKLERKNYLTTQRHMVSWQAWERNRAYGMIGIFHTWCAAYLKVMELCHFGCASATESAGTCSTREGSVNLEHINVSHASEKNILTSLMPCRKYHAMDRYIWSGARLFSSKFVLHNL